VCGLCRDVYGLCRNVRGLFRILNTKITHPMVTAELKRVKKLSQVNTERALKAARARYASDIQSCSEHAASMLNDSQGKVSNVKESEGKISDVTERKGKGRKGKESEVTVSEVTASDGKEHNRVNPQGHLTGKPTVKPWAKYSIRCINTVFV